MDEEKGVVSQFAFYVGEGIHYLGEDIKGVLVSIFGRGKPHEIDVVEPEPEPEPIEVLTPEELMVRIEILQRTLEGQQEESKGFERQLVALKQLVDVSRKQQEQIASELVKLSEVLHR